MSTADPALDTFRDQPRSSDPQLVRALVESTGKFTPAEVSVAQELVDERLAKGMPSGYEFVFLDRAGETLGYVCYGHIAVTLHSYDLYWIAVHQHAQGQGIGRRLLEEAERRIKAAGGTRVYIETSGRADYHATRSFYERCGYTREATLPDYYAPGDDRVIYVKALK